MKSVTIFASFLSALAVAGPVKRDVVTHWEVETVTVYVRPTATALHNHGSVGFAPSATTTAGDHLSGSGWAHWSPVNSLSTSASGTSSINTPSASASASSGTGSAGAGGTDSASLSDYAAPILKQHNIHRKNHTVPALEWDEELVGLAQQIASTCVYAHSNKAGDGKYGQNIGAGAPPGDIPKLITNSMYNGEMTHYPGYGSEPDMSNFEVWGHFSQIVWKDTKKVGCYTQKCASLANVGGNVAPYFTVCNYRPAGNYGGEYAANVLHPVGEAPVVI